MPADPRLAFARGLIDRLDAGIVALAAARRRAVVLAARAKPPGLGRDPQREAQVHRHGLAVARDLGLPGPTAGGLLDVLIADACAQQGLSPPAMPQNHFNPEPRPMETQWPHRFAARLPHPSVLQPFLARLPRRLHDAAFEHLAAKAMQIPTVTGEFAFLEGRTIGITVTDLGLRWSFGLREGRLVVVADAPEAEVRGTATDLLLLASRLEDADTLFFQRRLVLTGDTDLGLHARNTLDRLEWEDLPLGPRILMHRAARHAAAARAAWNARRQVPPMRDEPAVPDQ